MDQHFSKLLQLYMEWVRVPTYHLYFCIVMYFILQTSTIYLKSTYATLLYITCTKMKGGIPRLYSGISFALIQAPISRFISTAANDGVSVLLQNFNWGPGDLSTSCCFCVYADLCVCFHHVSSSHVYCISPT